MNWRPRSSTTSAATRGAEAVRADAMELINSASEVIFAISDSTGGSASMELDGEAVQGSDAVSVTELGYLDGVTSAIQTQLDSHYPAGTKIYRATLTQASTAAPVATVAQNTLGQTLTPARTSTGIYTLTAGGAVFTADKTQIFMGMPSTVGVSEFGIFIATRTSATVITINTRDFDAGASSLADGLMTETAITIIVYP